MPWVHQHTSIRTSRTWNVRRVPSSYMSAISSYLAVLTLGDSGRRRPRRTGVLAVRANERPGGSLAHLERRVQELQATVISEVNGCKSLWSAVIDPPCTGIINS